MDTRVMSIPRMNYPQYRKARRLTHECCNYCNGNCLLLDDGEECVCVQSISYSLLCRWFQAAVLPLDAALYAEYKRLAEEKERLYEQYGEAKKRMQEYGIIKQNVDGILRVKPGKEWTQEL